MSYNLTSSSWGEEEIQAIHRVIESNRFTMGENVARFEDEFAKYFNVRHAVMVNSGSSANLISIAALCHTKDRPLKRGDEVIVPAISWATTYHPLQQYGLKMRVVDVELDSLNIDTSLLQAALTKNTRAVVAVSILGNPAALEVIRDFADSNGLYLLEDNCESMDAEINGRKTGTFGHVNTFSFFFSHHISTMEGGMVLTDDEELYHLALSLRSHGWTRDLPSDSTIYEPRESDFFEAYRFILPGYNVRPTEMSGAVGREQLKKLPVMTAARRKNLTVFNELFEQDERFIVQREYGKSSSFSFPIILNPALKPNRERVFHALNRADIEYRIITGGCILRHDVIAHYDIEAAGEPKNANLAHDFGFFVGNHPKDLSAEIKQLHEVLDDSF